ncbi:GM11046 [Drosophila sechellia]|uniref:GM11046 n=3 Tax=Drosophila sechellia TaxID=7238 RepID=B4IP94_DROSE|nr:GM11046 [Drosophila sechellia]
MRLPASLRGDREKDRDRDSDKENAGSGSLIRRCASIAGSLVRPSARESSMENQQCLKRKRTQTLDSQYCSPLSPSSSSKRYRIRPREPIERMRRQ